MKRFIFALLTSMQVLCMTPLALAEASADPVAADNPHLLELFQRDQADRNADPTATPVDWDALRQRDAVRQSDLMTLFRRGEIHTANDHLRAANLFQHGDAVDNIRLAYAMATIASAMAPENKEARWLMAASWDRLMVRQNRPQWFGTQFTRVGESGPWSMGAIDDQVTDADRATYFVPPLEEMKKHLAEMNAAEKAK